MKHGSYKTVELAVEMHDKFPFSKVLLLTGLISRQFASLAIQGPWKMDNTCFVLLQGREDARIRDTE